MKGDLINMYKLIEEFVLVYEKYPIVFHIFRLAIIFFVAMGYNSYKQKQVKTVGVLLSSLFSYSVYYFIIRVFFPNLVIPTDIKIVISILLGFVAIEFFDKFDAIKVVNFIIKLLAKKLEDLVKAQIQSYGEKAERGEDNDKKDRTDTEESNSVSTGGVSKARQVQTEHDETQ